MSAKNIILIFLAGLAAAISVDARSQSIPVDGYAAVVNQRIITVSEVLGALQPMEERLRTAYHGRELAERLEQAYQAILDELIERALILEEFEQSEAHIPDALVDDHIKDLVAERFNNNRSAFMQAMAEEGITLEDFRKEMRERLVVMLLRREAVLSHIAISPGSVRRTYMERIDEFRKPEEIHLRMIVINKDDEDKGNNGKRLKAESAIEKLREGNDFPGLAAEYSEGSRAARGGDWGWITPDILRTELAEAAADLEPGHTSGLVETGDAFYILRVEDRRDKSVVPLEEVQEELYRELRRAEEERLYQEWINRLKQKHFVRRFQPPQEERRL